MRFSSLSQPDMPRASGFVVGCLASVALLLAAFTARAQGPTNEALAQGLYADATAAMLKKDFVTACPKLEEVTRLVPDGIGGWATLGQCYESAGKLASAWSAYSTAEAVAVRAGQTARAADNHRDVERLKPRVATVICDVPEAVRATP